MIVKKRKVRKSDLKRGKQNKRKENKVKGKAGSES